MRRSILWLCGVALSGAAMSVPAQAQALNFVLTGARTATFTLPSSTPNSSTSSFIGDQIFFNNIFGTFGGTAGNANISFGTNLVSTFQIQSPTLGFTQLTGPALFSGLAFSPTFNLGTFNLSGGFSSGASTLTISRASVVAAVPEPATWAMMLLGFGAIGFSVRRRRPAVSVNHA